MIRVLDKFIADKIAAGEVIERPVSAVKELVENSVDAGAGSVIVEIRGGGKSYIRVTDDGCGIPPEEAETAFLRHATSKISSISDLDNIRSLGFRGEALASISAVSRLTIVTRTKDNSAGIRLIMHGGKVISKETAGANTGTTIVVEDLFYNTPARRKFMGSDAREGSAIIELIQQYAVCYPHIRFMMIRNGETVFTTSGNGDTLRTIQSLYPDTAHAGLIPVTGRNVRGYVSDPGTTKNNRKGQLFFVNGRLVDSKVIEKGLENGYGGRIFSGFPVAILFIEADPSEIDVNIHPGKRTIKFLRETEVLSDISHAVSAAMLSRESVPAGNPARDASSVAESAGISKTENKTESKPYREVRSEQIMTGEQSSIREFLSGLKREAKPSAAAARPATSQIQPEPAVLPEKDEKPAETAHNETVQAVLPQKEHIQAVSEPVKPADAEDVKPEASAWMPHIEQPLHKQFDFSELEYRGYLFDTFIVMQSADTVYLFDQHAAHERIFYEKFVGSYLRGEKLVQPILTPVTLNVSADVYYMSREWLDPLTSAGFEIEDFGVNTFVIRGIPSYMELSEAESFARTYLEGLDEHSGKNDTVIDKLIMKSCKSAVKANEHLSQLEISRLIADLAACQNPYCCPHGRPTFIRYTRYEIERSFHRK